MAVPVFRPSIKRREMDNVLSCLVSDRIDPGALSQDLAAKISDYLGLAGGVCYSSYYASLSAAIDTLALSPNEHIIISALSPSIYLDVLEEKRLVPLYADVDPESGSMSFGKAEKLMGENPKAIIVHYTLGYIPDLEALANLGLPLIEDLSQGLGGNLGARRCGTFGELTVVSLDTPNIVTAGEGGVVLAKDRRDLKKLKSQRVAANHHLSDLNASLGLAQLKEIESFIATRRDIAKIFSRSVLKSRHKTLTQAGDADNVFYSFPVVLGSGMREVIQYSRRFGIQSEPAFGDSVIAATGEHQSTRNARNIAPRCILFPLYPMLGKKNVETISRVISSAP